MPEFRKVAVLGCGLMGRGIAEVSALAGYPTWVREIDDEAAERGREGIARSMRRAVEKEKIDSSAADEALGRIRMTTSLEEASEADLVIEAVPEDVDLKKETFGRLDEFCASETIFASNTSSLTITEMAAATDRPDRMVGLHFFNPVPVMKLVEVVRTIATSEETVAAAHAFARSIGKEPIEAKDNSGFVVNRLLVPYMLDAMRALEDGLGTIEDIDKGMVLGTGHPMGPFTLADFVGNDTTYRIAGIMFDEYREKRFAAPPLLKRMVTMGYLGRKSGQGFYDYSGDTPVPTDLGL